MCGWITGDSPRRVLGAPRRTSAGVYRVVELEHGRHDGASLSLPLSELIELPEEEEEEEEEEEVEESSKSKKASPRGRRAYMEAMDEEAILDDMLHEEMMAEESMDEGMD